jgi:hypothetical protein
MALPRHGSAGDLVRNQRVEFGGVEPEPAQHCARMLAHGRQGAALRRAVTVEFQWQQRKLRLRAVREPDVAEAAAREQGRVGERVFGPASGANSGRCAESCDEFGV